VQRKYTLHIYTTYYILTKEITKNGSNENLLRGTEAF